MRKENCSFGRSPAAAGQDRLGQAEGGRLGSKSWLLTIAMSVLLVACARQPRLQPAIAAASPANAIAAGIAAGPPIASLPLTAAGAAAALSAFRLSCPALLARADASGLTRNIDWHLACDAAKGWPDADAGTFFGQYFETAKIADGKTFATGYYEPEIRGSRVAAPGYAVPVYRDPGDVVAVDLGQFAPDLVGRRIRGRVVDGKLTPYSDRAAIEAGALAGRGYADRLCGPERP